MNANGSYIDSVKNGVNIWNTDGVYSTQCTHYRVNFIDNCHHYGCVSYNLGHRDRADEHKVHDKLRSCIYRDL